jgi:hypothetical protein
MDPSSPKCDSPGTSCGTPSGWRQGGRCFRCRTAHNADLRARRGLTAEQRNHFLRVLRAGRAPDEAAASAGVTRGSLAQAAIADGELRAALDGQPVRVQRTARLGDYLAALTRTGGDVSLACRMSAVGTTDALDSYREDPLFEAAERALLDWIDQASGRTWTPLPDSLLDRAAALFEAEPKPGITSVARAIGATADALRSSASRHERLRAALPPKRRTSGNRVGVHLTDEQEQLLREMWPDRNVSLKEIAQRLGIQEGRVLYRAKMLGLPTRQTASKGRKGRARLETTLESEPAGR